MLFGAGDEQPKAIEQTARADTDGFGGNFFERDLVDELRGGSRRFQSSGNSCVNILFSSSHGNLAVRLRSLESREARLYRRIWAHARYSCTMLDCELADACRVSVPSPKLFGLWRETRPLK